MRIERLFAGGDLPRQGPGVFDRTNTGSGALEAHRKVRDASLRQYAAIIRGQAEIADARQDRFAADGRLGQSLQAVSGAVDAGIAALNRKRKEAEATTNAARVARSFEDGIDRLVGAIKAGRTTPDGQVPEAKSLEEDLLTLRNRALDSVPDAGTRQFLEPRLNALLQGSGPQILRETERQRIKAQRQEADTSLAALARRAADSADPMARIQRLMDGFSLVDSLGEAGVFDRAGAERKKLAFRATLARGALRTDIEANPAATFDKINAGSYDALLGEDNRGPWADAATQAKAAREADAARSLRLRQAGAASELARNLESGAAGLPEVEGADIAPADRDRLRMQAQRLAAKQAAATRDIDLIEDRLVERSTPFDLKDASLLRALDSHYAAVARPWVEKPDADAPQRLAAYAERLGAVPPALTGDVLDSLQAGKPEQMVLAAETLDRITAALPGSLTQFPDAAANRAHLIVALTEAGLSPSEAVARATTQLEADAATRESRRPDAEAAAAASRNQTFLARAWADAAVDSDALPEAAQDRFKALFTDGYAATGDERVSRTLAFKRLLGEIGEGKGKDWVGEETSNAQSDAPTGNDDADVLWGGAGLIDQELRDLTLSIFGQESTGAGNTKANLGPIIPFIVQLVQKVGPEVARQVVRTIGRLTKTGKSLPGPKTPEEPSLSAPPKAPETRPVPKSEEVEPAPPTSLEPDDLIPESSLRRPRVPHQGEEKKEKQEKGSPDKRQFKTGPDRYGLIGNREFVRSTDGSFELGRIDEEAAKAMGGGPGPILLPRGGDMHMGRADEIKQIRDAGYQDQAELVAEVGNTFSEVRAGNLPGRFVLIARNGKSKTVVVEVARSADGTAYEAVTTGIFRRSYTGGRMGNLLWEKARGLISPP